MAGVPRAVAKPPAQTRTCPMPSAWARTGTSTSRRPGASALWWVAPEPIQREMASPAGPESNRNMPLGPRMFRNRDSTTSPGAHAMTQPSAAGADPDPAAPPSIRDPHAAARRRMVAEQIEAQVPASPETLAALLRRVQERQQAVDYPGELASWLETFASPYLSPLPPAERDEVMEEVIRSLRHSHLYREGTWTIDYVRLRFRAIKPPSGPG